MHTVDQSLCLCSSCASAAPQNPEELNAAQVGFWTPQESRGESKGHSGKVGVKVGESRTLLLPYFVFCGVLGAVVAQELHKSRCGVSCLNPPGIFCPLLGMQEGDVVGHGSFEHHRIHDQAQAF